MNDEWTNPLELVSSYEELLEITEPKLSPRGDKGFESVGEILARYELPEEKK